MKIDVTYVAQVRTVAGISSETVALDGPPSLRSLVSHLTARHGRSLTRLLLDDEGALRPSVLVFRGDEQIEWSDAPALEDGDRITLMTPLAGG